VISCYEVGYDRVWLHRSLEERGMRNHVIESASLQVDRRARGAKTGQCDAERLLRSQMTYLRGEPKLWSVVRVPSAAKRMRDGCIASAIVGSRSALRMSTASRDYGRSTKLSYERSRLASRGDIE